MSGKWEKTFEITVPVARVWEAFTNPEELAVLLGPPPGEVQRHEPGEGMEILEAVPLEKLRWRQSRADLPEACEFTVGFESRETGSAITVTRLGFGEGEEADIFSTSNGLGWEHGFRDMVLYLETGVSVKRHWDGCSLSSLGIAYIEKDGGLEVCRIGSTGVGWVPTV